MPRQRRRTREIVVLGGYGRVGQRLSRLLAASGGSTPIVIAGRNERAAEQASIALARKYSLRNISARFADANDPATVTAALRPAALLVIAASVTNQTGELAAACLRAGADYLDLQGLSRTVHAVEALNLEATQAGRLLVVQAGFCPGLAALLVRYVCKLLPDSRKVQVAVSFGLHGATKPEQLYGLVEAAAEGAPRLFRDGAWRTAIRSRERREFDFGPGHGRRIGLPFWLPELQSLPKTLGLQELAAFGATPDWRLDCSLRVATRLLFRLSPAVAKRAVAEILLRVLPASATHTSAVLCARAWNASGQESSVLLSHADVLELTALSAARFVREYLHGSFASHAGVFFMGELLDPEPTIRDLCTRGAQYSAQVFQLGASVGSPS
jgi:saccharopine dehydrogenase (NAD+, L-lysine forming)